MKRWTAFIGTAVVAAILAPVALAETPSDAHSRQAVIATAIQDSHDRAGVLRAPLVGTPVRDSHDRTSVSPGPRTVILAQDAHDRGDGLTQPRTVLVSSGGFDWGDAAIGAVSGMGIALLLAGLGFLVIGERTRTRPVMR